jgi:hypothetical protein
MIAVIEFLKKLKPELIQETLDSIVNGPKKTIGKSISKFSPLPKVDVYKQKAHIVMWVFVYSSIG